MGVADIAWIGTMQRALLQLGVFVSGPLYDGGYVRSLSNASTLRTVASVVVASFAAQ